MLLSLKTRNFALINDASLSFQEGLTVITGETGSGKSLLVNSLGLLAGKKGDAGWIREGTQDALVEGVFELRLESPVREILSEAGIPFENPLVVRRILTRQGKNRVFINDCASTLNTLKRLSPHLMEIQSQRDHHSFLHPSRHTSILDDYAGLKDLHQRYLHLYRQHEELLKELENTERSTGERLQRIEFLRFQIKELEEANLEPGEEEELRRREKILSNAVRCKEGLLKAAGLLSEDEPSARNLLDLALRELENWRGLDPRIDSAVEALEGALVAVEDQTMNLISVAGETNEDPGELQRVEERLDLIARFKPKYGSRVEEMLVYLQKAKEELAELEDRQEGLDELKLKVEGIHKQLWELGEELHSKREEAAEGFCREVEKRLKDLRLEEARLHLKFSEKELGPWGIRKAELLIEPNPGEGIKPLWKVASGGELSRITLAIHSLLSHRGDCDLWVLDEIDTGIGGETAVEVGRMLKTLAREKQILCITHLPQIAAFGEHHIRVTKRIEGERTVTQLKGLTREESREELRRMMGGEGIPLLGDER